MSAKKTKADLFARISASVKAMVVKSAVAHGLSMAREVERLLFEQLTSPPAQDLTRRLRLVEGLLKQLEQIILNAERPDDVYLNRLHEHVLMSFALREKNAREIERKRTRSLAADGARDAVPLVFAPLLGDSKASIPQQLMEADRRRIRFVSIADQYPRGTKSKLAAELGCDPSYVSQLLAGHRPINDDVARTIERFFGKPVGELDKIEPKADVAALQTELVSLQKVGAQIRASHSSPKQLRKTR